MCPVGILLSLYKEDLSVVMAFLIVVCTWEGNLEGLTPAPPPFLPI
jgi:hypothetical protein